MDAGETGNRTVPLDRELASTHWDDCWRKHHGCAVAKIERLSAVTEIKSADPMAEPLNHRRLKNGESCYRCGKVVTAWLSHICDERKTAPAEVVPPSCREFVEAFARAEPEAQRALNAGEERVAAFFDAELALRAKRLLDGPSEP